MQYLKLYKTKWVIINVDKNQWSFLENEKLYKNLLLANQSKQLPTLEHVSGWLSLLGATSKTQHGMYYLVKHHFSEYTKTLV